MPSGRAIGDRKPGRHWTGRTLANVLRPQRMYGTPGVVPLVEPNSTVSAASMPVVDERLPLGGGEPASSDADRQDVEVHR